MIRPSLEEFLAIKTTQRIPVVADLLADLETPLTAYWKLAHQAEQSFLLESITGGEQVGRFSLIGVSPQKLLSTSARKGSLREGERQREFELQDGEDPLHCLERELKEYAVFGQTPGLPKFFGGAVGYISYDFVRFLERLPSQKHDPIGVPDLAMMLFETVVVFDHARNRVLIVVLAKPTAEGYAEAVETIQRMSAVLSGDLPSFPQPPHESEIEFELHTERERFESDVQKIIGYIDQGDCIQVVLSQRWSKPTQAHPISIYRALRTLNPSPYMFLMRFGDFDLVGASPELLVSYVDGEARVRPIAGTRPRGETEAEDIAHEKDLLQDEKEISEHLMLIDLGRNDLGKVSESGTVHVQQLMVVERYSHVMHIVSDVRSRLHPAANVYDLVRAVIPAGTLSGAPKVRAMQIIDELEPTKRSVYGGAVGIISPDGSADLAIAIRCLTLADGVAHVQAGAGIVYDSVPSREWQETFDKSSAVRIAVRMAETGELLR